MHLFTIFKNPLANYHEIYSEVLKIFDFFFNFSKFTKFFEFFSEIGLKIFQHFFSYSPSVFSENLPFLLKYYRSGFHFFFSLNGGEDGVTKFLVDQKFY